MVNESTNAKLIEAQVEKTKAETDLLRLCHKIVAELAPKAAALYDLLLQQQRRPR
jgi:hypothetical protein